MSDLNPPSQTRPGPETWSFPARRRTAILRADGPSPTLMKSGTASGIAEVMERLLWLCGLSCPGCLLRRNRDAAAPFGTLAEQTQGVYVGQRARAWPKYLAFEGFSRPA